MRSPCFLDAPERVRTQTGVPDRSREPGLPRGDRRDAGSLDLGHDPVCAVLTTPQGWSTLATLTRLAVLGESGGVKRSMAPNDGNSFLLRRPRQPEPGRESWPQAARLRTSLDRRAACRYERPLLPTGTSFVHLAIAIVERRKGRWPAPLPSRERPPAPGGRDQYAIPRRRSRQTTLAPGAGGANASCVWLSASGGLSKRWGQLAPDARPQR